MNFQAIPDCYDDSGNCSNSDLTLPYQQDTLKNMNMQKLGTVSAGAIRPANFTKPNNGGLSRLSRLVPTVFDISGSANGGACVVAGSDFIRAHQNC